MAEYTPNDDHMRQMFCQGYARGDFPKFDEAHLAWTNWLAAHDARIRRDAWEEGWTAELDDDNPYETEDQT